MLRRVWRGFVTEDPTNGFMRALCIASVGVGIYFWLTDRDDGYLAILGAGIFVSHSVDLYSARLERAERAAGIQPATR